MGTHILGGNVSEGTQCHTHLMSSPSLACGWYAHPVADLLLQLRWAIFIGVGLVRTRGARFQCAFGRIWGSAIRFPAHVALMDYKYNVRTGVIDSLQSQIGRSPKRHVLLNCTCLHASALLITGRSGRRNRCSTHIIRIAILYSYASIIIEINARRKAILST